MTLLDLMNPNCLVREGVQMLLLTVPRLVNRVSSCNVYTKPLHLALSAPQPLSFPMEKFSGLEVTALKIFSFVAVGRLHSSLHLFTQDLATSPPTTGSLESFG